MAKFSEMAPAKAGVSGRSRSGNKKRRRRRRRRRGNGTRNTN